MASLQAKMFVVFALIATVPLVALSYLAIAETRTALADEVGRSHEDTARAAAAFVGAYVDTARATLAAEAARGNLTDQEARAFAIQNPTFESVRLVPQGAPLETGPTVLLAATENATLAGRLDVHRLLAQMQTFAHGSGEAILLTDADGRLLVAPSRENGTLVDWSGVEPVRRAMRADAGHVEFVDPDTQAPSVAGFAPVPRLGWTVVDEVPTSVAYAALTRLTAVFIVLSGILVGAVLLASVVLARRIVQPVRALTTAAGAVAAGKLATRIEPQGNDEIAGLARAFNEMAGRVSESLAGLRRSEARYRNLVESANDLILTVERDGTLSFVGPLAERLLGHEAADLTGKPLATLLDDEDRERVERAVRDVLTTGEPRSWVVHRIVAKDGARRVFRSNVSPVFGAEGAAAERALVVASDITALRREERFRESSFQMARLVSAETALDVLAWEGLSIAIAAGNALGGAVHIGATGALREAARAGAGSAPSLAALAAEAVEARAPVSKPGVRALPLLERGEAMGALVLVSDEDVDALAALASQLAVGIRRSLFEQRLKEYAAELESRVEARTAELQAKSEEMESFLYSVSHDLKAPLISIEGYAQGLEEDFGSLLEGDGKLYLERIRKNASLMERLILDILELSRIGRIREAPQDLDLNELLQLIAARLDDRFQDVGAKLVVQAGLPRVRGEPNRMEQLFTNLIENALKYRHPERPLVVRIEGERSEEGTVLRVIDNARGIPHGAQDQLFRIFQRLPTPAGMDDPGGTGMGLAIVKRIVDTHHGRIWVGSVEGEGSVFTVVLPSP